MSVQESKSDSTRAIVEGDFSIAVPEGMRYSNDPGDLPKGFAVTIIKTERNEYYNKNCGDNVEYSLESPGSAPQCLAIATPSRLWKDEISDYDNTDPRDVQRALRLAEPIISRLYLGFDVIQCRIIARESQIIKQEDDFYVARIANADGSIGRVTDFCVVTAEALYQGQLVINDTDQEDEIEAAANRWLSSVRRERKTETVSQPPQAALWEQEENVIDRSEEAAHEVLVSDSAATRVTVNNDFTVAVPEGMLYSTDPDQIFNDSAVVIMKTERSEYFDENHGDDVEYDLQSPGDAPECLAIATPTMQWKYTVPGYDSTDPEHVRQIMDQAESMLSQFRDKVGFGVPYRIIKQDEEIFVGSLDSGETPVNFIVITPEAFYQGQLVVNDVSWRGDIQQVADTWLGSIRRKAAPSLQTKPAAKTGETKKPAAKKSAAEKTGGTKKTTAKKPAATETGETKKTAAKKSTAEKTGEAKKPAAAKRASAQMDPDRTSKAIGKTVWIEGDTLRISAAFKGYASNLIVHGKYVSQLPIKRIVFEDGCEMIKSRLLGFCQLEEVELPDTVKVVEKEMLYGLRLLRRIEIPPLLEAIPEDFIACDFFPPSDLSEIVFRGNLVRSIGKGAFYGHDFLLTLTLPDGLREVGEYAFGQCNFLQVVLLPGTLEKIDSSAFGGDQQLRYVQVPPSVTDIAPDAFQFCTNVCFLVTPGSAAERFAQEQKLPFRYAQYDSVQSLLQDVGYVLGQPRFIEDEYGHLVAASSMTDEEDDWTRRSSTGKNYSLNDHTWVTINEDFSIRIPHGYLFSTDPEEIQEHRALVFLDEYQDAVYKKLNDDEPFDLSAPYSAPRVLTLLKCIPWKEETLSLNIGYLRSKLNDTIQGHPDAPCVVVTERDDLFIYYRQSAIWQMFCEEQVFFNIYTLKGVYCGQIWVNNTEDPAVRYKTVERWLRGIHTGPCKTAGSAPQNPPPFPAAPIAAVPAPTPASVSAPTEQTAAPSHPIQEAAQETTDPRKEKIHALSRERAEQLKIIRDCRFAFFGRNARRKKEAKIRLAKIEAELEKLT